MAVAIILAIVSFANTRDYVSARGLVWNMTNTLVFERKVFTTHTCPDSRNISEAEYGRLSLWERSDYSRVRSATIGGVTTYEYTRPVPSDCPTGNRWHPGATHKIERRAGVISLGAMVTLSSVLGLAGLGLAIFGGSKAIPDNSGEF